MRTVSIILIVVVIAFPSLVLAQASDSQESKSSEQNHTPGLMITGRSAVEVMPDLFEVTGHALGEAEERSEALELVSAQISELSAGLAALEGLSSFEVTTSEALINTVRPSGCDDSRRSRQERPADCSAVTENARIEIKIAGQPVEAAGAVVAFASELQLERVALTGFQVSDPSTAQKTAQALALQDAIDRASRLAEASGGTLGRLLAVSDQKNRRLRWDEFTGHNVSSELMLEEIAIADRFSPQVELLLLPEAHTFTGEIHAHFEIDFSE